jgi:hypothetical protein
MAKSKTKRGEKELDMLDRVKNENDKLKRENSSLRKQVTSLRKMITISDFGQFNEFKDFIKEKRQGRKIEKVEKKKKAHKWQCYDCGKGILSIFKLQRLDGIFYRRTCGLCDKKTNFQKYHEGIEDS